MKNLLSLILVLIISIQAFAQISGFTHTIYDETFISKVRLVLKDEVKEEKLFSLAYHLQMDANTTGGGEIKINIASIVIKPRWEWFSELTFGKSLETITYQFRGPSNMETIEYPHAFCWAPYDIGVQGLFNYGPFTLRSGIVNGSGGEDDNKSLDISARLTAKLTNNLSLSLQSRKGKQPTGERDIEGIDIKITSKKVITTLGINQNSLLKKSSLWVKSKIQTTKRVWLIGLYEKVALEDENFEEYYAGIEYLNESFAFRAGTYARNEGAKTLALIQYSF